MDIDNFNIDSNSDKHACKASLQDKLSQDMFWRSMTVSNANSQSKLENSPGLSYPNNTNYGNNILENRTNNDSEMAPMGSDSNWLYTAAGWPAGRLAGWRAGRQPASQPASQRAD